MDESAIKCWKEVWTKYKSTLKIIGVKASENDISTLRNLMGKFFEEKKIEECKTVIRNLFRSWDKSERCKEKAIDDALSALSYISRSLISIRDECVTLEEEKVFDLDMVFPFLTRGWFIQKSLENVLKYVDDEELRRWIKEALEEHKNFCKDLPNQKVFGDLKLGDINEDTVLHSFIVDECKSLYEYFEKEVRRVSDHIRVSSLAGF